MSLVVGRRACPACPERSRRACPGPAEGEPAEGSVVAWRWAARLAAALLAAAIWLAHAAAADAHPLGNFTVNRYSRLEIGAQSLRVRYVLDQAEIPTFQAMAALDADGDRVVTDAEKTAYATRVLGDIARNLRLTVDGAAVPLRVVSHELELLPGQAGLYVMRLAAWLEAPAAPGIIARAGPGGARVVYGDENEPERIGWREVLVAPAGGAAVQSGGAGQAVPAAVPARDVSAELRSYPDDLLMSPLDVREVRFVAALDPAAAPAGDGAPARATQSAPIARASDGFADLFTSAASGALTLPVVLAALLAATALGAMHALSPGHGKTIVGAYLVGARGTPRHALFLGIVVTAVHTAGVFALGIATALAQQAVVPERIYPWMSLLSGLLVLAMGASLVRTRLAGVRSQGSGVRGQESGVRDQRQAGEHRHEVHTHAGHRHSSLITGGPLAGGSSVPHSHGFGSHTHAIPGADGAPVTWRSLLGLGVAGGLLPCPSALVVMLGSIALNRVVFGLVLIVCFSAGLAATLVAIGLLMVYSGRTAGRLRLFDRLGASRAAGLARVARVAPALSAGVVALAGLALTVEAARQIDLPRLWSHSPAFRTLAANGLSVVVGALAVWVALRRSAARSQPAPAPVPAHTAPLHAAPAPHAPVRGHAHVHAHAHAHSHPHVYPHHHVHDDHAHETGVRENAAISKN